MPIKEEFPPKGSDYMGGESDGWEYCTIFAGTNLDITYQMVKQVLVEEGYGHIPIPETIQDLRLFQLPTRNKQILLFEDNGYVHNPIKILFPTNSRKRSTLTLCIYNEQEPQHLLKFHRKIDEKEL